MVLDLAVHTMWAPETGRVEGAMTTALVPMCSLLDLLVDSSKDRLRAQLREARRDVEFSRALLGAERKWRERMVEEVEVTRAAWKVLDTGRKFDTAQREADYREKEELREAYRRELESNGKLRAKLRAEMEINDKTAFMAGVDWARKELFALHARLWLDANGLPTEKLRAILEEARDIPF